MPARPKASHMPLCRDASLVKHMGSVSELHVLKCRSWACERCRPDRQKRLYWECRNGDPNRMLTLTIRHVHGRSPGDEAKLLVEAWRMLRQNLTRLYKTKIPFMAVFEKHPTSGRPHLHILMRSQYLDIRVIRGFMVNRLQSPQVNILHIDNPKQASGYITKYCSKSPTIFGTCRRYWRSQDWSLVKKPETETQSDATIWWEVSNCSIDTLVRIAILDGLKASHDGDIWKIHGVFRC